MNKEGNFIHNIFQSLVGASNRTIFVITFSARVIVALFLTCVAVILKLSDYYYIPDVFLASSVAKKVPTIKRDLDLDVLKFFVGPEGNSVSNLPLIIFSTSAFMFVTSWFGLHGTVSRSPSTFYGGAIFSLVIDVNLYRYFVTTRSILYILERSKGEYMANVIENHFGKSTVVELLLNQLQSSLQCCGGISYKDYERSLLKQMVDQHPSFIPLDGLVQTGYLPTSCCHIEKVIVGRSPLKYCHVHSPDAIKDRGCYMMILPMFISVAIVSNYAFLLAALLCGASSVFMISSSLSLDEEFFFAVEKNEDLSDKDYDSTNDDSSSIKKTV